MLTNERNDQVLATQQAMPWNVAVGIKNLLLFLSM